MLLTAIGAFLGAVLSIIISIVFENQRNPKLQFTIENPPVDMTYQNAPANKARFLRVQLWNKALPKIFRWLSRNAAMHCNVDIEILHFEDFAPVFSHQIPGRWAGADEPISPQFDPKTGNVATLFDVSKYNAAFRRNCYAGSKETIDIVARFDTDSDCYIWNNNSYLFGWKNDELKIPKGRYFVIVTVFSAGEKTRGYFKLENTVSVQDFRLLDVNKEEKKVLSKK
jgi:hypothetical protein